mgnify:CR=1 FL=1
MAGFSSLEWNGPALTERLRQAQIKAVEKTLEDCVVGAKRSHEWRNRSGVLEGGIGIVTFPKVEGDGVRGVWGVQDVRYALIHELGGVITPKQKQILKFTLPNGETVFAKSVTIPARPYLRPQADIHYPKLARRVAYYYRKGGGGE